MSATHIAKLILTASLPLILLASAAAGAKQPRLQTVRDLRYGEALYDFYHDQYFRAITDIMVAQARSPISKQGNAPELLLGSLYLSYGMHAAAADVFDRLLSEKIDPYIHDLAWFYLGRMRYMDGQWAKALEAFKSISNSLPESKDAERLYFMVNAYLYENNYSEAVKVLDNINGEGIWDYYARYNLGVALIRTDHVKEGMDLLGQLARLSPKSEEEYTIRDKANIAIGYASVHNAASFDPIASFSRVRLSGPFSNQALLGIGWAYNANKQPRESLKPWMELSSRPAADSATQEALIAIAYTLEQLKQRRLALTYYEKAVSAYDQVRAELDTVLSGVDYVEFLRNSLPSSFAFDDKWSDTGVQIRALPAAEYLNGLLTSREFQKAYRDYRDLNYLRLQVDKWNEKIPMLRIMLEERRRQYTINVAQVAGSRYAERLTDLYGKRAIVASDVADIEDHEKINRLATQEERDRLKQLQEIKSKLDALAARGLDVNAEIKEYRILYGLTQWKLYTEYPLRLWQVKKGLRELDRALAQGAQAQSSLENVLDITPLNFDGFSDRIGKLERYLKNLSEHLDSAAKKQEQYCNQLIIDALSQKRRQVDLHRTRALYAQARLSDQLSHEPDAP